MRCKILVTVTVLILILTVVHPRYLFGGVEISQLWKGSSDPGSELDHFLEAKEHVLEMEWERASRELEAYLEDFPSGHYRDEALYWLGRSLNRMAVTETDIESVIDLKLQAAKHLDSLLKIYPSSVWRDDAEALRLEISGELALMGEDEHKKYLEDLALKYEPAATQVEEEPQSESDVHHRILALHTITVLEPGVVLPILKRTVRSEPHTEIRKEAMSLMAEKYPEDALPVLREIEQGHSDKELWPVAVALIEGIRQMQIPAYLNYYAFRLGLEDEKQSARIPEGKLVAFDLPRSEAGSVKRVQRALKDLFHGKASDLSIVTFSFKAVRAATMLAAAGVPEAMTYREVDGFRIELPFHGQGFTKRYDQIKGKIRFVDLENRKKYEKEYTVDYSSDQLFIMRKGERCVAFVLQFESAGEDIEIPKEPKYNIYVEDIFGAELRTTRRTVSTEELLLETALVDYGQSRAEIPSDDGEWILIGHILLDTKEQRFIGRKATLISPAGRPVVHAAEIVVPINDPDQFYVARSE